MLFEPADAKTAQLAFQEGAALIDLREQVAPLIVSGSDTEDFLQRMISGDLRRTHAGRGVPSTLMNRKGKLLAAFEIYPLPGRTEERAFLVVVESSVVETLRAVLEKFVVLEEVAVSTGPELGDILSVQGPGATPLVQSTFSLAELSDAPYSTRKVLRSEGTPTENWLYLARCSRSAPGGWDLYVPPGHVEAVAARLVSAGVVGVSLETAEAFRIDAGIPRFGIDATDAHMPPESGYDAAISYDKGCYAGQEVVARIRTYGHVNKLLRRIRFGSPDVPSVGDPVFAGDRETGRVTSSCLSPTTGNGVALAYVRYAVATAGTRVQVRGAAVLEGRVEPLRVPDL